MYIPFHRYDDYPSHTGFEWLDGSGAKSKEWVGAGEREGAFLRLLQALELELGKLWEHRAPDDAFLLLFSRAPAHPCPRLIMKPRRRPIN